MKNTIKHLSKTRVEITIILGEDELAAADAKALARLRAELKLPGFRKGKAPLAVAKKHLNPNDLVVQALDFAVRAAVPQAFLEAKIQAVSVPEVAVDKYVVGELIEFRATADILPEIKLGNYKALKVKRPDSKAAAGSVDKVLEDLAGSVAEKKAVKRAAKLTDEVQVDFVGKQGGEPFDGGSAKDFKLALGSGQFIPGFEKGIVGHNPGDKFELDLAFPKDYHAMHLAGKKVVFEVLLKQVNEVVLPKIDDDLAKKVSPFQTLKELKADIVKNLDAQAAHSATEQYKDALVAALVSTSTVEAPETLIADQTRFIKMDIERKLKSMKMTEEQFLESAHKTKEELEVDNKRVAKGRVEAALVLQTLSRELGISTEDKEAEAKAAELKEVYKKDANALKNLSDPRVLADIKNRLTIEKTLDALVRLNG